MVTLQDLTRFPFFAGLGHESLRELAAITGQQTIPAGTRVFSEGDTAHTLYVIVRGEVEIAYPLEGGELRPIQTLRAGDLLVWSAIIEPYRTTAVGTTKTEVLALAIDAEKLRAFFERDPALSDALMQHVVKLLSRRLQNARSQFAATATV